MAMSELADWWDRQRKESEKILDEWVMENPQWWAIGIATATSTAMELGAGMVDVLRLGEGAAQGGVSGLAKDALRLLVVLGPVGRAGGALSRLLHTQMIRLAVTTRGVTGPCTFTAVNNAASIVGGRGKNYFLTARDAAKALNKTLGSLGKVEGRYKLSAWIDDLVPFLARQGVKVRCLGMPNTLDDVVKAAQTENGVVIFAVRWVDDAGKVHGHSMIAVRDAMGQVRFADYGGKLMRSLSELAQRGGTWVAKDGVYGVYTSAARGKGAAVVVEGLELTGLMEHAMTVFQGGMLLLEGVSAVETTEEGVDLALPVQPAAVFAPTEVAPEMVKASFEAFKARKQGKAVIQMPPLHIKAPPQAPRPDWLTGVQYRLNYAGFAAGPVDGIMGPKTRRAVRWFQEVFKLPVTGIPDAATQAKLVAVCRF